MIVRENSEKKLRERVLDAKSCCPSADFAS